jgi:hypothetical protein
VLLIIAEFLFKSRVEDVRKSIISPLLVSLRRKNAGPVVARNVVIFQKKMFLMKLEQSLPSKSLLDQSWIEAPVTLRKLSLILKPLFHELHCAKYRDMFDKTQQALMREKLIASQV